LTVATEMIETEVETPSESSASILLVDDRRENLIALRAILEPLGERLVEANSGMEALRHLLREEFALILMDAEMPGINGFETAALIQERERTRHVPIIFVTAHGRDERLAFRSYSVGAVDYLPKPFDPDILRSKVRVFVDLYKKNEQLKHQAALIHEAELREAERRQSEMQEALEREHMRRLTEELERRVEERTAELKAANAEMEAFCYSVSHDLRAPLRAIMASSMMMLEEVNDRLHEDERELLRRQSSAAKRLGQLIDDLLHLSRLGRRAMQRREVDLSELAENVVDDLRHRPWPAPFEFHVEPGLRAYADPGLLRILFDNLLENACKYSPDGGRIEVGRAEKDGESAFFVRDSGIGFDMKYVEKIFLPFERLVPEEEYEGTGIGLANVQRIVQRHGGNLWAESEMGKGTVFYFTLG